MSAIDRPLDLIEYLRMVDKTIKNPPARGDRVQFARPFPPLRRGEPMADGERIEWAEITIDSDPRGRAPTFTTGGPVRIDLHELEYWIWDKHLRVAGEEHRIAREYWAYERLRVLDARNRELEAAMREYAGWSSDNAPALGGAP